MCAVGCEDWRHSSTVSVGRGINFCCSDWELVQDKYCDDDNFENNLLISGEQYCKIKDFDATVVKYLDEEKTKMIRKSKKRYYYFLFIILLKSNVSICH